MVRRKRRINRIKTAMTLMHKMKRSYNQDTREVVKEILLRDRIQTLTLYM